MFPGWVMDGVPACLRGGQSKLVFSQFLPSRLLRESLTEPGVHCFSEAGQPAAPGISVSPHAPSTMVTTLLNGYPGFKPRPCLCDKQFSSVATSLSLLSFVGENILSYIHFTHRSPVVCIKVFTHVGDLAQR